MIMMAKVKVAVVVAASMLAICTAAMGSSEEAARKRGSLPT